KELREELSKYIYKYMENLITLDTHMTIELLDTLGEEAHYFNLTNGTIIDFEISIHLPAGYSNSDLNFYFRVEFGQIQTFIDKYINTASRPQFIDVKFIINRNLIPDTDDINIKQILDYGVLKNLEKDSCIN